MKHLAFLAAAAVLSGSVQGAERQPEVPLVANGEVTLTTADFEAYLEKVPDNLKADFRSNLERIRPTVDGLWVYRLMAQKAREAGLQADPITAARVRQAQDMALAEAYMKDVEKKLQIPDLTPRAREVYNAQPEAFKVPEQVHVEHILVATNDCRNKEQALARAREIHARVAKADEEAFLAEAEKSSDDPSKGKNRGDLGTVAVTSLDPAFATAVAKLTKPGAVSEPVETRFGWHIIRFVERKPARTVPFEEVKDRLVSAERQKVVDRMRTEEVNKMRIDPGNHVYVENVEALARDSKPKK